jgi:hypothetical protein
MNKYLEKERMPYKNEVKMLERKIDVIFFRNNKICSVEIKVKNWKKALEQAIPCQLWSHYTYVAIWYKNMPNDLSLFEKYGIGLISVKQSVQFIIEAVESAILHDSLVNEVKLQMGYENE